MKAKNGTGSVPSMQNVAAYAGVSIATVSKVMQGDATVRAENVTAVQNAIEALGYRINPLAAELRRGRRQLIGVIVPCHDETTAALINSFERHAAERGYALWAASSNRSEQREGELIGRFQDWRVAGLIVMPVPSESGASASMINGTTATVFVEGHEHAANFDAVRTNLRRSATDVLDRLVGLGHQHMAVVGFAGEDAIALRLKSAFAPAGPAVPMVRMSFLDLSVTPQDAVAEIRAQLDGSGRPTAVIALGCQVAGLIMAFAAGRKWSIPSDLSIVTFQGARVEGVASLLTAVCYPAEAVGLRAVDSLLRRVEQPAAPLSAIVEECQIELGSSIGAPQSLAIVR
jgi:DNA-binding LacI/PurR family transcriptional regulator